MRVKNESAITVVILATGVASVVTQLLTIREFLALFAGNEFVIAIILFNWLICGGIGTMLAYRAVKRGIRPSLPGLAWFSLAVAAMAPIHLLGIRLLRNFFFIYGSETGFYQIFTYILATTAPYCLMVGFALPYSLFVLRRDNSTYPGAMVYIIDNIGDISGGILFSFLLLFIATPMQSLCITGLLLVVAAIVLFIARGALSGLAIAGIALTAVIVIAPVFLETGTMIPPVGNLAYYRESRIGRILVARDEDQFTLFLDGIPVASSNNRQTAEETAHYPLSQVNHPGHVLTISAVSGIMDELVKHHPQRIDYVEIDPELTKTMFRFHLIAPNPAVNVIYGDARAFLSRSSDHYDAIIMCLPEPETYQLNRYYTLDFFSLVKHRLAAGGVFSFSMRGFDNYPTEADRKKLSAIYNSVTTCFSHVLMLPGEDIYFLCGDFPLITEIPDRLRQQGVETSYINYYFSGDVTAEKIEFLKGLIDPAAPVNRDTRPRLMRLMFARWFSEFNTSPLPFYIIVAIFLAAYLLRLSGGEFVLFSSGFANMAAEILAIFAFQIFFGYIYYQIGLIVTVFLAGLLPGAWFGRRARHRLRRKIMLLDGLLILLSGLFAFAVISVGGSLPAVFFLLFGFIFSCVCGFQFPAILRLIGDKNRQAANAFTADLVGAAFGALLTSTVLIPYIGLAGTATAIMGLKATSIIITGAVHETN